MEQRKKTTEIQIKGLHWLQVNQAGLGDEEEPRIEGWGVDEMVQCQVDEGDTVGLSRLWKGRLTQKSQGGRPAFEQEIFLRSKRLNILTPRLPC